MPSNDCPIHRRTLRIMRSNTSNELSKFSSEMAMQSGEPSIPEILPIAEVSCDGAKRRCPFILLQIDSHPSGFQVCIACLSRTFNLCVVCIYLLLCVTFSVINIKISASPLWLLFKAKFILGRSRGDMENMDKKP